MRLSDAIDVPTMEQCHWDAPPVPRPLYVCWHPCSDDCWNMMGQGQTKAEAYQDLLDKHQEWLEDQRDKWDAEHYEWEKQ